MTLDKMYNELKKCNVYDFEHDNIIVCAGYNKFFLKDFKLKVVDNKIVNMAFVTYGAKYIADLNDKLDYDVYKDKFLRRLYILIKKVK